MAITDELKNMLTSQKSKRLEQMLEIIIDKTSRGEGVGIAELASHFGVATKTIQRDILTLGDALIRKGRKLYFNAESSRPKNADDAFVLNMLDELAKSMGENFYGRAHILLRQLQSRPGIFAFFDVEKLTQSDIQNFIILENALDSRLKISFMFEKDGGKKRYFVKPLKLAFFDGFWYLLGFDTSDFDESNNEIFKKFSLKNISAICVSDEKFKVNLNIQKHLKNANSVWFRPTTPTSINLFIDKSIAKYFMRKPRPTQKILSIDSEGNLELELLITHEMEILPLIFHYLPMIKVLSPETLALQVKNIVKGYLDEIS